MESIFFETLMRPNFIRETGTHRPLLAETRTHISLELLNINLKPT